MRSAAVLRILIILALFSSFISSESDVLHFFGFICFYFLIGSIILMVLLRFTGRFGSGGGGKVHYIIFGIFILYMMEILISGVNAGSITRVMQLGFIWGCIFLGGAYRGGREGVLLAIRFGSNVSLILLIVLAGLCVAGGWEMAGQLGDSNTLGLAGLSFCCWAIAGGYLAERGGRARVLLSIFLGLLISYFSMSRTALFGLVIFSLLLFFINWIYKLRSMLLLVSLGAVMAPLAAIAIYIGSFSVRAGVLYAEYFGSVSNKSLDSGRQLIWPLVWQGVTQKPWLGWGLDAAPRILADYNASGDFSSHNLYLQILLQSGWVGLILWMLFFYHLFSWIRSWKDSDISKFLYAYLTVMLLTQSAEVTLTQNNLPITVTFWIFLGCAIACSVNREKSYFRNTVNIDNRDAGN